MIDRKRIKIEEGGKKWEFIDRWKGRKRRIRAIEGKSVAGIKSGLQKDLGGYKGKKLWPEKRRKE